MGYVSFLEGRFLYQIYQYQFTQHRRGPIENSTGSQVDETVFEDPEVGDMMIIGKDGGTGSLGMGAHQ